MSNKQLHEIQFVDKSHYDLYLLTKYLHLEVKDPEAFGVEKQEYKNRYKVSLSNHAFYVKDDFVGKFWLMLKNGEYDQIEELIGDQEIGLNPQATIPEIDFTALENDPFYNLVGEDFLAVDRRMEGLVKATGQTIREVAVIINKEMDAIALDTNVVKDFDGILTFNTELGKDFKVQLCFDKVPPVFEDQDQIVIERTPITEADLKMYFPTAGEKIQSRLKHVNDLVASLFASKRIAEVKDLCDYAAYIVNGVIVRPFLDQNVTYVAFGGKDSWASSAPETPNNVACFRFLDEEVEKIFAMLEGIPKEEGVEVYSIDIDTFAVFGRKDNQVVTPALQGYTGELLKHYSQGFERVLTKRLAMIDSPYVFKA